MNISHIELAYIIHIILYIKINYTTKSIFNMNKKPNIVYFFVDDMGYGDASCLNPEGKIPTPNIDRLAKGGMKFTDAHSSSAVCSPSRYSVLTGRYNWRSTLQKGIVPVFGDSLISEDRTTVPGFLKEHGYQSACIGKWHLGQSWDFDSENEDFKLKSPFHSNTVNTNIENIKPIQKQKELWQEVFSKPTLGGPTKRGFDYYYGVDVPNWPPYCFIENDRTVGTPSEFLPERLLGDNQASWQGPAMPHWHFEQLLPTWAKKANEFIEGQAGKKPFFLYLPMTSPHTPLSVNKEWIGKSGLNNLYADLVMETDDILGQVMDSLEKNGLTDNTLIIFASDNGCAHYIGTDQMEKQGHYPSGPFRGYKSDAWDGGHRIPCVAKWPGVIKAGVECKQLVCLSDLMATCADIVQSELPHDVGEDSFSMLPIFANPTIAIRDHIVHHSISGKFAIRNKKWKLILAPGSGGWTHPDKSAAESGLPLVQLYDMENDCGEKNNLSEVEPEIVKTLLNLLKKIVAEGRSTPGERQNNDVPVDIWKLDTMPAIDRKILDDY
jgi:arylsulfatase A